MIDAQRAELCEIQSQLERFIQDCCVNQEERDCILTAMRYINRAELNGLFNLRLL